MHSKKIVGALFISALIVAFFHDLAIRLNWYYLYPSIDIPLHILGGFVVGLFIYIIALSARRQLVERSSHWEVCTVVVLGTFLVSLVWEVFELVFFLTKDAGLSLETLSDIFFGLVGAILAWVFIWLLEYPRTDSPA